MRHTDRQGPSIAALAVTALLLAGCGGEEDGAPGPTGTTSPTGEATASASPTSTAGPTGTAEPTATGSPTATAGAGDEATTVAGVIAAAVETVPGSRAFELDRKDGEGWEVTLAVGDREQEVDVSEGGSRATAQPGDDDLDDEDRRNLAQVAVPLEVAVRTALQEADGSLDEAELGTEGGTVVWEIDVDDEDGSSVDVYVNVGDGSVLKIDR
ncbi:PepSY domain-containing protein [Kocuria sp. M1R5S2]|uniref:PepSY domain-containing protein n=1 Tax=Kocuria rhizosphaerae TaxID=3376285 RepID=UPI00379D4004